MSCTNIACVARGARITRAAIFHMHFVCVVTAPVAAVDIGLVLG